MHELSVALGIIEGVEQQLLRNERARVTKVYLKVGLLSGVVKDALLFSYDLACEGTPLEGSALEIEEMPVMLYCHTCGREQPAISIQNLSCVVCNTPSADIRRGHELEVFALELMDEHAAEVG